MIQHPAGIMQIDADYVAHGLGSVYLIRQGDRLALIETGTAHTVPHVLAAIAELGLTPEHLDWIILTHIHLDHAAGAGALMEKCPNAKLVVHPRGAAHMINPAKLEAGTMAVYGEDNYRKLYGALIPVAAERVVEAAEGFTLNFHGRTFTFFDTPGHALHHVCIHDSLSNALFSGDTFGVSYRTFDTTEGGVLLFVTTTPVHFDPQAMRASIERIAALEPAAVYLTHYGPVAADNTNVAQLLASLDAFVAIASAEKEHKEGRVERMAAAILDWLMARARELNPALDDALRRRWLATDARLNAQGLEVWLSRQEALS